MGRVIHPFHAEDWQRMREVRLRALADAPEAFSSTLAREQAFDEVTWRRRAGTGGGFYAELDGRTVGLVGVVVEDPPTATLVSMWVAPEARRHGVGRDLVVAVVDHCRARGLSRVNLWVVVGNTTAQRLYGRLGFTPTGRRQPVRPGEAAEELEMVLPLTRLRRLARQRARRPRAGYRDGS